MLKQRLEKESNSLAEIAGEIVDLLQVAAARTRDFACGLSPVDRDEGGLESTLEELATSTRQIGWSFMLLHLSNSDSYSG
jgi:signal transduction histidine kinase